MPPRLALDLVPRPRRPRRIALTLKLDDITYAMLCAISASEVPRRTHQDILESALISYIERELRPRRRRRA